LTSRTEQLRRVGPIAISVVLPALLIAYLYVQRAYVSANYDFPPGKLLGLTGLAVLTLALRGMTNQLLFARLGVTAPLREWFAIASVSALSSYLPATARLVSKANYLKRVHSVPYREFAVGQVALLLLGVATHGAVGLATIALWRPTAAVWIAIGFAAMSAVGCLLLSPHRVAQVARGRWFPLDSGTVARLRGGASGVIAAQIGVLLATASCLKLGFSMGPAEVSFAACMAFSAGTVLTRLVWVTPGGLGLREFGVGALAVLTGHELQDAVIASFAWRLAEISVDLALGGIFSFRLAHRLSASSERAPGPGSSGS
jgi:uncharacterized membrane protein YbhN (UPF0104 family)